MPDPKDMSRRDWFRLKSAKPEARLGETTPIELPPNHDGMNLDELPPLREATLSDQQVVALLDDIQRHGTNIQLMQRRAASQARATVDARPSLEAAKDSFLRHEVPRIQIRYQWNDQLWIDTLARQETGTRLVRVAHDNR